MRGRGEGTRGGEENITREEGEGTRGGEGNITRGEGEGNKARGGGDSQKTIICTVQCL